MTADGGRVPLPAAFFELAGEQIRSERHRGQQSWYVRGRNFVTVTSWAAEGEVLAEPAAPDEHAILVPAGVEVAVTAGPGQQAVATGPAVVIVPAGSAEVVVQRPGYVLRVFTTRGDVGSKAINDASYAEVEEAVTALPLTPTHRGPGTLRVISMSDEHDDGRQPRSVRTDSILVTWFVPEHGPHDTDELAPCRYDDVEHASITLGADFVHHLRRPWTRRMRDWRPDEHVQVTSPSVSLFPAGNIHVARAVGRGEHQLIDVLAPPHIETVESGQIVNQSDYEPPLPSARRDLADPPRKATP